MESSVTTDYRGRGQLEGQKIHLPHPTLQQMTMRSSLRMVLYSSLKVYNTIRQVKIRDLNAKISPENTGPSIGQRERARRAIQRVLFDHLVIGGSIFPTVPFTKPREAERCPEQPTEIQMKSKFKQLQIVAGKHVFRAKIGNCLNAITTAMMTSPFHLYSHS